MIRLEHHRSTLRCLLRWVVPLALGGTLAALAYTDLRDDSITFDELGHLTGGVSSWTEKDFRLFPQNGQFPQRWATLPLVARVVRFPSTTQESWWRSDLDRVGHQLLYESGNDLERMLLMSRSMVIALGVLLGFVVFAWSKYLFGWIGGCVSLALYTFSPSLIAHSRLATSDVACSLTFTLALLCLWRALHRVTIGRVLGCTAAIGLLLVSKMSGLLILPVAALLLGLRLVQRLPLPVELPRQVHIVRRTSSQAVCLAVVALLVGLGAMAIVWASYGFRYSTFGEYVQGRDELYRGQSIDSMTAGSALGSGIRLARDLRLLPEPYLFGAAHVLSHSRVHPAFMNGRYSRTGWACFFLYAVLVKTPLPAFLIAALAAVGATPGKQRKRRSGANRNVSWWSRTRAYRTTPLLVFLVIYWAVSLRVHLSIGERHVLPTYPAAFILCGAAGRWVENRHWPAAGILAAALVWLGAETVGICPHYLSYFNQAAGGPGEGYRRLVDSSLDWGQDLGRLRRWLEDRPQDKAGERPVYLSYFGSGDPASSGIAATLLPCYLDWREEIDFHLLQPGTYCVSATMLQSVYGLAFGPWNGQYEQLYQQYYPLMPKAYGRHVPMKNIRDARVSDEEKMIYEFEQLRFARLCAHLRRREPDERVGYSILVYHLSASELRAAVGLD